MQITRFVVLSVLVVLAAFAAAQDNAPPKRLRVSSGIADSLKIHDAQPHYPREAKERGIQGDVLLQAAIDTKGNLTILKVVQGDPILVKASLDAVKKWRYRPYRLNGEPVEVETTIKIQFLL